MVSDSADAEFGFSADDGSGSGVASVESSPGTPGAWSPCSSPHNYSALAEGSQKFEVRAIDNAGNIDASPANYEWTIDTIAPTTQLDSGPTAS